MGVGIFQMGVAFDDEERVGKVAIGQGVKQLGHLGLEAIVHIEANGLGDFPVSTQ